MLASLLLAASILKIVDRRVALARWPFQLRFVSKRGTFSLAVALELIMALPLVLLYSDLSRMVSFTLALLSLALAAHSIESSGGSCPCFGRAGGHIAGWHVVGLLSAATAGAVLTLLHQPKTPLGWSLLSFELAPGRIGSVAALSIVFLAAIAYGHRAREARRDSWIAEAIRTATTMTIVTSHACTECMALLLEVRAWEAVSSSALSVADVDEVPRSWSDRPGFGVPGAVLVDRFGRPLAVVAGSEVVRGVWERFEDRSRPGEEKTFAEQGPLQGL